VGPHCPERHRHPESRGQITAAIVDRLTFAGQIIETSTTSYRLAQSRKKRSAAADRH